MFILIPIAMNLSLTSKRAYVCIVTAIATSLMVSWDFSSFLERRRRDWSLRFVLFSCNSVFSLDEYYFANPNGEGLRNWIANHISKFHDNPTVNTSGIIVLLKQFWVSAGKEKSMMQRVFLSATTCFRNFQRWECSEMSSEPDAQISRRSNGEWVQDRHFFEIGLVVCEKKRGFWEEEGEKRNWVEDEALLVWKLT